MAVPLRRGRPRLPDRACYIRVRSSVYELWRASKNTLGFRRSNKLRLCGVFTASNRQLSIKVTLAKIR